MFSSIIEFFGTFVPFAYKMHGPGSGAMTGAVITLAVAVVWTAYIWLRTKSLFAVENWFSLAAFVGFLICGMISVDVYRNRGHVAINAIREMAVDLKVRELQECPNEYYLDESLPLNRCLFEDRLVIVFDYFSDGARDEVHVRGFGKNVHAMTSTSSTAKTVGSVTWFIEPKLEKELQNRLLKIAMSMHDVDLDGEGDEAAAIRAENTKIAAGILYR